MATSSKFKQINPFISRVKDQSNAAHLSWMQTFVERMQTNIVSVLGQDCPAMVTEAYQDLAAAVQVEDDCFRIITRSALTEQIQQADTTRDNTFVGLRTMVEALERVGTAAQKDAAPRILQAIRDYQVSISENYEMESVHIAQLIQVLEINPLSADCTTLGITALVAQLKSENQQVQALIAQRNEEQASIDPTAMQRARQAVDQLYVDAVTIINAHAVTTWEQGESPYDYAIGVINQDEVYYVQHVFPKPKLKKVKITDDLYFFYTGNETWAKAIEEHPQDNAGWTKNVDEEVVYQDQRLLDKDGAPVMATKKPDPEAMYSLEGAPDDQGGGDGGDVTPVTPESEG